MGKGAKGLKLAALAGVAWTALAASPATAQDIVWVGGNSSDWFAPGNWGPAGPPGDGNDVRIITSTPNPTIIAAAGARSRNIFIGAAPAANGRLTVNNSGTLTTSGNATIGDAGGTGEVLVIGANARWTIAGSLQLGGQAGPGSGRLTISQGAIVNVAGGTGTVSLGTNGGVASLLIGGDPCCGPGNLNAARVNLGPSGLLRFQHNATNYDFAPVISGNGNVSVLAGTTRLLGDSSAFTGTTTIGGGGSLHIGNLAAVGFGTGGETGNLGGNIVNNGALVLSRNRDFTFNAIISGSGSLTHNVAGIFGLNTAVTTLNGQHSYTGATTINNGRLLVTGSIASSSGVTVNTGGRLGGTGTVPRTTVTGGGLVPGLALGTIGTLSVAGNFTMTAGSYFAEVAPASADLISISGSASLGGRLAAIATGGAYTPGQFTLLTAAGGRSGTFGTFDIVGNFSGLFVSLSYTANSVVLNLAQFTATDEERWLTVPATNLWNTGTNWNPASVPIGTARFGPSSRTTIVFSQGTTQIGRLLFDADAPAYTFNFDAQGGGRSLNILGEGIVNNSTSRPSFFVLRINSGANDGSSLNFFNASTAGNARISSVALAAVQFGVNFYGSSTAANASIDNQGFGTAFHDSSTAGNATITNELNGTGGATAFFGRSTAGSARITNSLESGGVGFFDNASAGSATIVNRSNSSFVSAFLGPGTFTTGIGFGGSSTAANATITNDAGNTAFWGSSSAGNATIVNSGGGPSTSFFSLLFGQNSSAGSATITNNSAGIVQFQGQANAGNATITNNQGGETGFAEQSAAAGATIVNNAGGSTQFFNATSAGTARITNNSGGRLFISQSATAQDATIVNNAGGTIDISSIAAQAAPSVRLDRVSGAGDFTLGNRTLILGGLGGDFTLAGLIADGGAAGGTGGSLTKIGAGTLTLSGANTYTGATTISAGTLQLGNGGGSGSLAGNIANNAAFVINRTGALTLGGVISGSGTFTQNGTVITTLSGINTYTGATTLNGGASLVTGSIAGSAVTVNNGATLGGTGTVGSTSITTGGTLSPGLSIGTLSIAGNLSFASGSNFIVEVAPASADRVNVTGNATLAGTLTALSLGGTFSAREYTLLNAAGGVTGTFNTLVTQGSFGSLRPSLRYDGNSVFLVLAAGGGGTSTTTTSETDAIIFNAPTIEVRRVGLFETRIIGRLAGGTPLFDQTVNSAFGSAGVQNALAAARLAITAGGGPGVVVISDPVLISRTVTSTTSSSSVFSLAGTSQTVTTVTTFGPATITIGDRRSCGAAIGALPSSTRPACGTPGGASFTVAAGTINVNTNTQTTYAVNEARTDTITETTRETYELTGTVAPVGTVHAAVQSGLFELGGRFLARMGEEGAPARYGERGGTADGASRLAPGGGGRGWAEFYGYRARADARGGIFAERRDARGLAGGFSLIAGEGLTIGFAVDRSALDLGVPGSGEEADVDMTQLAASARFGSGPFSLGVAFAYGFGNVESRRTLGGVATAAAYDVDLVGGTAEARYTIETGGLRLVPVAALDWVRVGSDAFTETGPFGLAAPDANRSRTRASVGLEAGTSIPFEGGARLDLAATGRYAAILSGEDRALPVAFNAAPGTPLTMRGLPERDSAILGAQAQFHLTPRLSLYLAYDGRFASGYDAHGAVAGLRLSW